MAVSYISEATADLILGDHKTPEWDSAETGTRQFALIAASEWLDEEFGGLWIGTRADADQVRDWPRAYAYDSDGYLRDDETIPVEVQNATAWMAYEWVLLDAAGSGFPRTEAAGGNIASERKKIDVLEIETAYVGGKTSTTSYPKIRRILRGLLSAGGRVHLT